VTGTETAVCRLECGDPAHSICATATHGSGEIVDDFGLPRTRRWRETGMVSEPADSVQLTHCANRGVAPRIIKEEETFHLRLQGQSTLRWSVSKHHSMLAFYRQYTPRKCIVTRKNRLLHIINVGFPSEPHESLSPALRRVTLWLRFQHHSAFRYDRRIPLKPWKPRLV
jgi:hypothetical protein